MSFFRRNAVFVLTLLLMATMAFGQGTTSNLTGTVTMDGAGLPGVTVTISSPALQGTRTAITDVNGNYNFAALPPGTYTVRYEMEGMQTITKTVAVTLATTARSNAVLKLSSVAEAITVTATAPAVSETSEVQTNFQASVINELPLNRTFASTADMAPGVTTATPSANQIAISGAPASESLYLVNGAVVNENVRSQIHNLFIEDAIQEQTILTGSISAEYGRFTGGVVSAITKSGGNEFSGSLRDNFTNPDWTSKTPLASQPDPLDTLNEVYEATFGGRIIRDRLWFFTAGRYYKTTNDAFLSSSPAEDPPSSIAYTSGQKQTRYEVKLTGQITPKHSLVGSYLSNETTDTNYCFIACYELSNIDSSRVLPNDFIVGRYNGVLTSNFLLEAGYSKKKFAFKDSGGDFTDFAHGSFMYDVNTGYFFGAPVFCGICGAETRDNKNYNLKATYYLATKALGTHNLVAGYDDFAEQRLSNNYQSGSNFEMDVYNSPLRASDGSMRPIVEPGDLIWWWPVLEQSQGSDLATKSIFVNDRWDVNSKLNVNLGIRHDANDVVDSSGAKTSDDSAFSPRLGLTYDFRGDGRFRATAGWNRYVSHIQETIGGSGGSPAGSPAFFVWLYDGPSISGLTTPDTLQQVWDWFQAQGGVDNTDGIIAARVPGVNTIIRNSLASPSVDEITVGFGTQISSNGVARIDLVKRDFNDFYSRRADMSTGTVTNSLGQVFDLGLLENGDYLKRTYSAAILQGSYRFTPNLNFGANYTWSETKGNFTAETSGSGPVADQRASYPEYKSFAQNSPDGLLPTDQTDKLRAWASYSLPTPIGHFTFGAIERFDSGTPYEMVGSIDSRPYVTNPGYKTPPTTVAYYFTDRGALRWDNATSTDLALTYELPITRVNLWVKGDLLNVFDEDALISGNTTVFTATSASCVQNVGDNAGKRCAAFNPFTETPVEGVNYRRSSLFGQATAVGNYQLPRTYRFAVGVRF